MEHNTSDVTRTSYPGNSRLDNTPIWRERRRPILGLPLSLTVYTLYPDRLIVQTGLFTRQTEEIRLYRILDTSLRESLIQRLFHLGSIKLITADSTAPKLFLHDIREPAKTHRLVSDLTESQRMKNRIGMVEFFDT